MCDIVRKLYYTYARKLVSFMILMLLYQGLDSHKHSFEAQGVEIRVDRF